MSPKTPKTHAFLFAFLVATLLVAPLGFLYAVFDPGSGDGGGVPDAGEPDAPADRYSYTPLAPLPGPSGDVAEDLEGYLKNLFWLAIVSAGVLAVLMITIGGLRYTASEAFGEKMAAQNQITMAIAGFILAISSVLILQTINPDLLKFNLTLDVPSFTVPGAPGVVTIPANCNPVDVVIGATGLTECLWVITGCTLNKDMVAMPGACSTDSPFGGDIVYNCCGRIEPKNGCSGQGVDEGFKECAWSIQSHGGNDCTSDRGMPGFNNSAQDRFCSEDKPGGTLSTNDCCYKI